jgi:hypothetical protein
VPVVTITLMPIYSREVEARVVNRLARATRSVIGAAHAGTTVFVQHSSTYQRDGHVYTSGGAVVPDASALVREFLERLQARELDQARKLVAPDFVMTFPAAAPMSRLEDLVQWAGTRYRQVSKHYEGFDESWGDDGTVVYCRGTLSGTWLDGSAFGGVRFIDRFLVAEGLIRRQDVWNDLGEIRAGAGGSSSRTPV